MSKRSDKKLSGPPRPVSRSGSFSVASAAVLAGISALGFLLNGGCWGRTMGSTMSARLKWEQRRQEAVAVAQAEPTRTDDSAGTR